MFVHTLAEVVKFRWFAQFQNINVPTHPCLYRYTCASLISYFINSALSSPPSMSTSKMLFIFFYNYYYSSPFSRYPCFLSRDGYYHAIPKAFSSHRIFRIQLTIAMQISLTSAHHGSPPPRYFLSLAIFLKIKYAHKISFTRV